MADEENGNGKRYKFGVSYVFHPESAQGMVGMAGPLYMTLAVRAWSHHEALAKLLAALKPVCQFVKMED